MKIWQGVYQKLSDVPSCGPGFASQRWLNSLSRNLQNAVTTQIITQKKGLLPLLAGLLYSFSSEMRIIDFGGGMGGSFRELKAYVPDLMPERYFVVEGAEVCALGKNYWGLTGPRFYEDLSDISGNCDLLLLRSSLHYVKDWQELLKKLVDFLPRVVLIEDVPQSLTQSFATGQNYYDSVIPCWFLAQECLIQVLQDLNYSCFYSEDANSLKNSDGSPIVIEGASIHTHTRSFVFVRNA